MRAALLLGAALAANSTVHHAEWEVRSGSRGCDPSCRVQGVVGVLSAARGAGQSGFRMPSTGWCKARYRRECLRGDALQCGFEFGGSVFPGRARLREVEERRLLAAFGFSVPESAVRDFLDAGGAEVSALAVKAAALTATGAAIADVPRSRVVLHDRPLGVEWVALA